MSLVRVGVFCAACILYLCNAANAIIIPYGDFQGATVDYLAVTENTFDEPSALFGAPSIQGDTLDFDPPNFRAFADPNTPSRITDGQLNTTIMYTGGGGADAGIEDVIIREGGDFTHIGLGPALAQTTVSTLVRFDILEVAGTTLNAPISESRAMVFTPEADGMFDLANYDGSFFWDGFLGFDVDMFLDDYRNDPMNPMIPSGRATKIELVLDNILTAAAINGGSAEILKKDFKGVSITIPEPAAIISTLVGVLCLLAARRK